MYITAHSSGYLAVSLNLDTILDFFCVGIMYSGEYDASLRVYAHRVSLKNMPGNGGSSIGKRGSGAGGAGGALSTAHDVIILIHFNL